MVSNKLDADGYHPKAFLELKKDFKVEFSNCEIIDGTLKATANLKKFNLIFKEPRSDKDWKKKSWFKS